MDIKATTRSADNEDYALDLEETLDIPLRDLIDKAVQAGWSPRAIYKAV